MAEAAPAAPAPGPAAGSPRQAQTVTNATVVPRPLGKPSGTPAPVEAITTPTVDPLKVERERLADEKRILEVKMARLQRKHVEESKTKEKTWGEKLSKLTEYEKRDAQAKINKTAYLESLYGKDWYDQIVAEKLNGGAPTADVVASEIAKLREEFEARLTAKDAERTKALEESAKQSASHARQQLRSDGMAFWKNSGKEFPALEGLGGEEEIGQMLAQRLEQHYNSTCKRDEDGRILADGEILSLKQVAEALEAQVLSLAEKAVHHAKYAERLGPKKAQPATPAVGGPSYAQSSAQRRTLSNDMTASTTTTRAPPVSDEERRERAAAAYLQAARKQ